MTDENTPSIRDHFAAKLMETAGNLERDGTLPADAIATVFVATGAAIAGSHRGGVATAEWLRDMADAIECDDLRWNATIN